MPIRSRKKRDSNGILPRKLGIGALIAVLVLALAAFAITETNAANTSLQGANGGMMQWQTSGQSGVAACDQMMAGSGVNQTTSASMDSMMSGRNSTMYRGMMDMMMQEGM